MTLQYNLLDEPLIRTRLIANGQPRAYSLPGLLVALGRDEVRDFPALRPHQRHPWHAFLVQLAAMALHRQGADEPFRTEAEWKTALLALTPEHPDGAAWCLVGPHDRPAFMQAPVPGGMVDAWSNDKSTPDSLDVLVTSKNHDLKQGRIRRAMVDDWIFALVSLQTQAPYPGAGNSGVVRMNGGSSSRPGLGLVSRSGNWGARWVRDVRIALAGRDEVVGFGYKDDAGLALLWLLPWDGESALSLSALDPFFIEICRRVRLISTSGRIIALRTTSKGPRISKDEAKARKGNTGDLWTPVHIAETKSLGITGSGFDYRRMTELAFGSEYKKPFAQEIQAADAAAELSLVARAIAGGQSTTDGYHERHIPISSTTKKLLFQMQLENRPNRLAKAAAERVDAIGQLRGVLWTALATLFDQGAAKDKFSDSAKDKAGDFTKAFEQGEDIRFFDALNDEIEAENPDEIHLQWLLSMAERAEVVLVNAFTAGPQASEQRYRARAAALSRFHAGLRNSKALPVLANHLRQQSIDKEPAYEHA